MFEFVNLLEIGVLRALAWRSEELGTLRGLPLLDARCAEVCFTAATLSTLYHDVVTECAFERFSKMTFTEKGTTLEKTAWVDC